MATRESSDRDFFDLFIQIYKNSQKYPRIFLTNMKLNVKILSGFTMCAHRKPKMENGGGLYMPVIFVGIILGILCICIAVYLIITGKTAWLEKRGINIIIFVLSLISLFISLKLFWNMGIYADEYGSSPVLISGGWFWLYMDWARLGVLFLISIISGLKLFKRSK